MLVLNFKELPQGNKANGEQDTFELFARDFFEALGYEIEVGSSRGADGGRDLVILEPLIGIFKKTVRRWIVSCKHKAHSGKAGYDADELDIPVRITRFNADGFIGFYSTLASTGLSDKCKDIEKENFTSIELFDRAKIEKLILFDPRLRQVLRQYFPNDYSHLTQSYTWEKFYCALLILVTDDRILKERLVDAYTNSLIHLNSSDLPKNMQEEFEVLCANFTKVEPEGNEGSVIATLNAMSDFEAKQLAENILDIYECYRTSIIDDIWQDS